MRFNHISRSKRNAQVIVLLLLPLFLEARLSASVSVKERSLVRVVAYGSNPTDRYPLDRCQGDCDNDSQCKDDLVCFQRGRSESVPGCDGGTSDRSASDYCIDPDDLDDDEDEDDDDDVPTTSITNFALKLYWQSDYRWQDEDFERKWCMECRNGSCDEGDKTYISKCGKKNQRYDFVFVNSDDVLIRLNGKDLCFERKSFDIFLRKCDSKKQDQLWYAQKGDFRGDRFEISPRGLSSHCITQRHHPKDDEEVELERCTGARNDDTSYWNRV